MIYRILVADLCHIAVDRDGLNWKEHWFIGRCRRSVDNAGYDSCFSAHNSICGDVMAMIIDRIHIVLTATNGIIAKRHFK